MSKSTLAIFIYVAGLIFGALILNLWSAETGPKAFIGIIWTVVLLIALFYTDKHEKKQKSSFFHNLYNPICKFLDIFFAEIMHLKGCKNLRDGFIKNEYILYFKKSLMKRNYIQTVRLLKNIDLLSLVLNKKISQKDLSMKMKT